jgi:2,5-diamino-6-(ribosylamino)-4(3H)-pyrimidinone 5'-phosphate reductase
MAKRPYTTLFLIQSLDGKISTGVGDERDVDKDYKTVDGVKEGLHQYYELEAQTDRYSLNSGKVMAKIGVNERDTEPDKIDVSFVILDNQPHLTQRGVEYLSKWVKTLYLVTTNPQHRVYSLDDHNNIVAILYPDHIDLTDLLERLYTEHRVDRLTIQTGGTLNAQWVRLGLIDEVSIVVAPVLVGGKDTPTLVDGESIQTVEELAQLKALKLINIKLLEHSFLHLRYQVIN